MLTYRVPFTAVLLLAGSLFAAEKLPDPPLNDAVVDSAQVLNEAEKNAIRTAAVGLSKNAQMPVCVVTIPSLKNQTQRDYVVQLLQDWHSQRPEGHWDRGVVMLYDKTTRKYCIYAGNAYIGVASMQNIIDGALAKMVPAFRSNRPGPAIEAGVEALCKSMMENRVALNDAIKAQALVQANGAQEPVAHQMHTFERVYTSAQGKALAELETQYRKAYSEKDNKTTVTLCEKMTQISAHDEKGMLDVQEFRPSAWYNLACAHALLSDKERAIEALEKAIAYGYDNVPHMRKDSDLTVLKGDPRFEALLATAEKTGKAPRAVKGTLVRYPYADKTPGSKILAWGLRAPCVQDDASSMTLFCLEPTGGLYPKNPQAAAESAAFWDKVDALAQQGKPVVVEASGGTYSHATFQVTSIKLAE